MKEHLENVDEEEGEKSEGGKEVSFLRACSNEVTHLCSFREGAFSIRRPSFSVRVSPAFAIIFFLLFLSLPLYLSLLFPFSFFLIFFPFLFFLPVHLPPPPTPSSDPVPVQWT